MPGLTSRLKLPWAKLEDQADIETATQPLAEALDGSMLVQVGTGAPPTEVAPAGCWYMRTFTGGIAPRLYISDGVAWTRLSIQGGTAPIGAIMAWGTGTGPMGDNEGLATWMLCDGTPLLATDWPLYADVVGNTWGGDATHYNLPDLRGRTLIGSDRGAARVSAPNNAMAKWGGAEKHPLVVTEMPSHRHRLLYNAAPSGFISTAATDRASASSEVYRDTSEGSGTPLIENTGGNGAHNNLQPYIVVDWYIRVK